MPTRRWAGCLARLAGRTLGLARTRRPRLALAGATGPLRGLGGMAIAGRRRAGGSIMYPLPSANYPRIPTQGPFPGNKGAPFLGFCPILAMRGPFLWVEWGPT